MITETDADRLICRRYVRDGVMLCHVHRDLIDCENRPVRHVIRLTAYGAGHDPDPICDVCETPWPCRRAVAREEASRLIVAERARQDAKWGEQNHGDPIWLLILTEEVGEAAEAILKARGEGGDPRAILDEAVQCAAVALAWVEALLRNGPKPGRWEP